MEIPTNRVLCLAQGPQTSGDGDQGQGLQRFPTSDTSPCLRVVSTDQRPSALSHKSRLAAPQGRARGTKQRPNPELRLRWTWVFPWCHGTILHVWMAWCVCRRLGAEPFSTMREVPHEWWLGRPIKKPPEDAGRQEVQGGRLEDHVVIELSRRPLQVAQGRVQELQGVDGQRVPAARRAAPGACFAARRPELPVRRRGR